MIFSPHLSEAETKIFPPDHTALHLQLHFRHSTSSQFFCVPKDKISTSKSAGSLQSECGLPGVDNSGISLSASKNGSFGSQASGLSSSGSSAEVGEGVADSVGDDVWVQGLLLDSCDLGIVGLESELSGWASSLSTNKLDGWVTGSEWACASSCWCWCCCCDWGSGGRSFDDDWSC